MLVTLSILFIVIVAAFFYLWACSRGTPLPLLESDGKILNGSISERLTLTINGAEQSMFIKGVDSTKPVLLYVHGGMPDYFLSHKYPPRFQEDFVVVWWEQRGAGMSYKAGMNMQGIRSSVLIADIIELSRSLSSRFSKEKIYLAGHSGGTFIAIQAAARAPELFHAYIGIAQVGNQLRSEQRAYEYMMQQYLARGDKQMVRKLKSAPVTGDGVTNEYLQIRDKAMHQLGIGTMRKMKSVVAGLFIPSLLFPEYSMGDKVNLWRAKAASGVSVVWNEMMTTDMATVVPALEVPAYFIHGNYDYTCSYVEARRYFEVLQAPVKGFYTFDDVAHSPLFEDPARMQQVLRHDVLQHKTSLADQ